MSALHEPDELPDGGDQPKREPLSLLTVQKMLKRIEQLVIASEGLVDEEYGLAKEALEFLQAQIDKGVLAVVKTAHSTGVRTSDFLCSECRGWTPMTLSPKFCMHCSAKIHNP